MIELDREAGPMEGDLGCYLGGDDYNKSWNLDAVVRLGGAVAPYHDDPFVALPPPQQDVLSDALLSDPLPSWQEVMDLLPAVADPDTADLDVFLSEPLFPAALQPPLPPPEPQQAPTGEPPAVDNKQPAEPSSGAGSSQPQQKRNKRNKQDKVPQDKADVWSWRKYGQKVIKGSPYPRGYYRCNSNINCQARKQVVRCSTDPSSIITTFTGQHCHPPPPNRNALVSTKRHKVPAPPSSLCRAPAAEQGGSSSQPAPLLMLSAPAAAAVPPPTPPVPRYVSMEEIDKEDDEDALALQALVDNAAMTPEDACLFINPDYVAPAPVTGGGGGKGKDNQMLPMPENKALDNANRATESESVGGGQAPVPNVFMVETAFFSPWDAAWP